MKLESHKSAMKAVFVPQVEIVPYNGPHRRLWMGPQFTFKTYRDSPHVLADLMSPSDARHSLVLLSLVNFLRWNIFYLSSIFTLVSDTFYSHKNFAKNFLTQQTQKTSQYVYQITFLQWSLQEIHQKRSQRNTAQSVIEQVVSSVRLRFFSQKFLFTSQYCSQISANCFPVSY